MPLGKGKTSTNQTLVEFQPLVFQSVFSEKDAKAKTHFLLNKFSFFFVIPASHLFLLDLRC